MDTPEFPMARRVGSPGIFPRVWCPPAPGRRLALGPSAARTSAGAPGKGAIFEGRFYGIYIYGIYHDITKYMWV